MPTIKVTALRWAPPVVQGLVRDLRVRWALEEAGLPYEVRLIGPEEQKSESYLELQPFGQVPAYESDGLALFESGAIVLHIAEQSAALLPSDPHARARAKTWIFAALNSVEPPIMFLNQLDLQPQLGDREAALRIRPAMVEAVTRRLKGLAAELGDREYLVDRFGAADLLMTTVLRIPRNTDLLAQHPTLDAYCKRCEARPAFQKALADQLKCFADHAPVTRPQA
jgi:glutathione S-transferase